MRREMAAFAKVGVDPRSASPEESSGFVRAEHDKWAQVVAGAKLRAK